MDKFYQRHKLPKFVQEAIDNPNVSYMAINDEFVAKNLPTKKTLGPDGFFIGKFY